MADFRDGESMPRNGEIVCGEKMCHAEHAWLRDGVCLCYMSSGGSVTQFYLYPFTTTQ
jgi:hypothetical protein